MQFDFHPCALGDLPIRIQLGQALKYLELSDRTIRNHWQTNYSSWIFREKSGLFVDVKSCDSWLDARGKPLLSARLLSDKKRRNPGWIPISEQISPVMVIEGLRGAGHV